MKALADFATDLYPKANLIRSQIAISVIFVVLRLGTSWNAIVRVSRAVSNIESDGSNGYKEGPTPS